MHDEVTVCERARVRRRRVALAAAGAMVIALGVWGVVAEREPADSVPLTMAPEWLPPTVTATSGGPATSASPDDYGLPTPPGPQTVELGQTEGEVPAKAHTTSASPRPATSTTAVTPLLSVTAGSVPYVVDLTREGTRDWVHWGLSDGRSVDRKSVSGLIYDVGGTVRGRYENNPQLFTWSDGYPNSSSGGTPTGVYTCGQNAYFSIKVPAGTTLGTVRLYAGVWMARAQLTVTLNGDTSTQTLDSPRAISTRRYEIRFRAKAAGTLYLTWAATAVYQPGCGNVDLQAVTLS